MKSAVGTFIVVLAIGMFFGGMAIAQSTSNTDANIELVRKHHEEVWSKGNMVVADEIYLNDLVRHSADMPDMRGREPYKRFILACREAFPDWKDMVENVIVSGDLVVTRYINRGTMTGTMRGPKGNRPPTGKHLEAPCAAFFRIAEGKIAEVWFYYDSVAFANALNVLPPPPAK
ncbi:MAG: ester cyclase [Deltaproteobacteria bacterium]|nr:ester cyclase [Deltaproteobacteria bacterium]